MSGGNYFKKIMCIIGFTHKAFADRDCNIFVKIEGLISVIVTKPQQMNHIEKHRYTLNLKSQETLSTLLTAALENSFTKL